MMKDFLLNRKLLQANLTGSRSPDGDFTQKRQQMDKLELEQRPHATRFRTWKTSFRREVIAGSSHPRHALGWWAEVNQAK